MNKRKVILNKVFPNASYMTQLGNLGHEIVNLFKEDTGKFYIHLNPNGTYSDEGSADILNISEAGKGLYQIISKAVNCKAVSSAKIIGRKKGEERYKQQKEKFKYGGEYIEKYFDQNVTIQGNSEKDLFVTFECLQGIYEPKESIYIAFNESNLTENKPKLYKLVMNWGRRPCRRYINESDDINKLMEIIDNNDLWQDSPIGTFDDRKKELEQKSVSTEENCFSFLGVDKQELQYSNALIKILKFKPQFLSDFLEALSKKDCRNNNFDILREEKSIDLLFRDLDQKNGKIFIIENKIDADVTPSESEMKLDEQVEKWIREIENIQEEQLNDVQCHLRNDILGLIASGKGQKPSQLSKYYVIAVYWALKAGWSENKIKEDIYCYFLCPKYHGFNYKTSNKMLDMDLALSEKYQLITYEDIFNIFNNFSQDGLTNHQKFLLNDFISAISMLAKERDDSMELKMIRLFIERYEKIKAKQEQTL